ncbi:receptor-type tyrosine-protein phosphatase mu-like [Saccoglossus kowalevskii]|uniref:Receptor-type tyrosine-protein phosphatase mu-like n=1 Tax=Saccoglossus kowalevskii TaxID=10224 RepID=A0ABM0MDS2_SACKO|nr:PREDICTED: receptor-type tyrosine-protein phosphatase mu-like [Saccoglossus kowalevskii]
MPNLFRFTDGSPRIRGCSNLKVNPDEQTYFICEFSGNPVIGSDAVKLWKSGSTNYVSPTSYKIENKYKVTVNFSGIIVTEVDIFYYGVPDIGLAGQITVNIYELPEFHESNTPIVFEDTRHSDQLTVTWNAWNTTTDYGNGPVESYKVYYRESDSSGWTSGQVIPVIDTSQMTYISTITGLHWSTEYEITVTVKRLGLFGEGNKRVTTTSTTLCAKPNHPIITSIASTGLTRITIEIQFPSIDDIKCNYNGTNGYVELIKVKLKRANSENIYQTKIIYISGQIKRIHYFDVIDNTLLPYTEYDVIVILENRDEESDSSGKAIVKASTSVGYGIASSEVSITTAETVPDVPGSIDILAVSDNTVSLSWTDPILYKGNITQYKLTYTALESVYTSVILEVKRVTLEGDTHSYTLALPPGTKVNISVKASTSIGFGEAASIISGTKLEVVEEIKLKKKRGIANNQYIIAAFLLNEIPNQLTVGDGAEYNGYINTPLTPGQQYTIYDGLAVYTTGNQSVVLRETGLAMFTGKA